MSARDIRSLDSQSLDRRERPAVAHEFAVHIQEDAFDRMVERGNADTTKEVGGILVGEVLCDESGPYVVVETTIDALHAEEKGAELTITHATWDHIHAEMDSAHQGKRIVGWYHTHPGFGVFLSDRDQFIHGSFFDLPFQIAFVYDPIARDHGTFVWRNNATERLDRYWIGRHMHHLEAGATDAREEPEPTPAPQSQEPLHRAASPDGLGPWMVPMVALLVGLMAGWLLSPRTVVPVGAGAPATGLKPLEVTPVPGAVNTELIRVVRDALDQESIDQAMLDIQSDVTSVEKALANGEEAALDTAKMRGELRRAKQKLERFRKQRAVAADLLRALGAAQSSNGPDYVSLSTDVSRQRATLAGLLSELAKEYGDAGARDRARRHLLWAAQLDPRNHARYENQLKRIDPKATLPRPRIPLKPGPRVKRLQPLVAPQSPVTKRPKVTPPVTPSTPSTDRSAADKDAQ